MLIQQTPPLHLTYCLNIHRGESWAENFDAIKNFALPVRDRVAEKKSFGLGLRVAHQAALDLSKGETRKRAREFFDAQNVYAFTINGFPFGKFHAGRVKENVYAPDWQTRERVDYTIALAGILADFLPEKIDGSISTVPCSFKPWITSAAQIETMTRNLCDVSAHLASIFEKSGREIHLGLEPEPSCFLETTDETVSFFNEHIFKSGRAHLAKKLQRTESQAEEILRRHLGVCFDTCHVALQFENLADSLRRYEREGIRVSKIQISNALRAKTDAGSLRALEAFQDTVYLHQVKARDKSGAIHSWVDLPEALSAIRNPQSAIEELRCHFHVPLFFENAGALGSTGFELTPEFWSEVKRGACSHLEIETYTFDVLPVEIRPAHVVESIAREFDWTLARLR
jgi:sugar phosphate isomerase/epimerase